MERSPSSRDGELQVQLTSTLSQFSAVCLLVPFSAAGEISSAQSRSSLFLDRPLAVDYASYYLTVG
jgi:hypothetical protein